MAWRGSGREVPDPCECRMGPHCIQAGPQGDQTRSPAAPGSCMGAAAWGSCSRYWVREPAFLSILCENHIEQSPALEGKQGLCAPQGRKRLLKLLFLGAMGCVYADYLREWVSQAPCAPWSRACPHPRPQRG